MKRKKRALSPSEAEIAQKVAGDRELLSEVLRLARKSGKADKRFDLNLVEGQVSENLLADLLSGKTKIEVKRDFAVSRTGNILIEVGHNRGKTDSGLTTTESDWYGIVFDGYGYNSEVVVLIQTDRLKDLIDAYGKDNKFSGQKGYSTFKIIRKEDLLLKI